MRILFIVPYVPTRIRVRPYNLLKVLIDRGHEVTLATLWSTAAEQVQLQSLAGWGLRILAAPLPRLRSFGNCLSGLPTATPLQAVYCRQPRLSRTIDALLERETFDVIHVEHLRGVPYGLAVKDKGPPVVWDSVDCISHLFEQAASHSRSLFGKWMTRLELGRTRRYEGWLVDQFQTVLVTSAVDRQALERLALAHKPAGGRDRSGRDRIKVLPNGVDHTYFKPNGSEPEPDTLVFSGKMSYHANVTMALYLVQEIMPRVWAERPAVKVNIVGQNPPASVQQLGRDSRVNVTGYVADMRPYLQGGSVAVVPSAYGAGIQNKVLEAMACATPVIATNQAVAALKLTPDRDLVVANDAETFARQVIRLLDDAALRQTIGRNGYRYVRREHAWPQIGARLEEIYEVNLCR